MPQTSCPGGLSIRAVLTVDSSRSDEARSGTDAGKVHEGECLTQQGLPPGAVPNGPTTAGAHAFVAFECAYGTSPETFEPARPDKGLIACNSSYTKFLLGPAEVTSAEVVSATVESAAGTEEFLVHVELREAGATAFAPLTEAAVDRDAPGNTVAIVVGDRVVSAPQVAGPITGGQLQITGSFSEDEAEQLADAIAAR
ncbi:hypothetical protein G9H71_18275 [Motilibacter sp. E257]|uniref:SecDF P1 head subdomain domain-containing protein n=2 Tax=Motilibacter deserti TaxID=2714956 RepID=A0ABX0GXN3_9ACTN|nr:hypothetical protein [Motilibacter deserti]